MISTTLHELIKIKSGNTVKIVLMTVFKIGPTFSVSHVSRYTYGYIA